ncbi:hypothetical protein V1507DRAFT_457815 [Lipomyces tetrasporus]
MLARLTLSQASLFTAWAWISSSACRLIRCNPTVDWRARASEFTDMVNRIVAQQRPSNWAMYQLVTTTLKILPHDECRSGDVCRVGHLRTCYLVGDPMSPLLSRLSHVPLHHTNVQQLTSRLFWLYAGHVLLSRVPESRSRTLKTSAPSLDSLYPRGRRTRMVLLLPG